MKIVKGVATNGQLGLAQTRAGNFTDSFALFLFLICHSIEKDKGRNEMKKTKAVALMMMVIMFMVLMPQALWVSAAEKVRETDFTIKTYSTENNLSKEEEAYILYEDKEKRTENEKHFVLSDGTMMME